MELLTTTIAVIFWIAVVVALACVNPFLAFFPALYLLKYLD